MRTLGKSHARGQTTSQCIPALCKDALDLPRYYRSEMCECFLDVIPSTADVDIRNLQFYGRHRRMERAPLPKQIFLTRLFLYFGKPKKIIRQRHLINVLLFKHKIMHIYLHLPGNFPIKCVGGQIVLMRAWLHRYANQHSAIYIVLLSAYEVVDVNG